jgi:predicted MFS family arabinose efflux permease
LTTARTPVPVEAPAPRRRSHVLDTFRFHDFRLLWAGLLVSNLGTWMQFTALGYIVVRVAGSPALASLYLGVLGACNGVTALVCSPFAGVIADRYPRRRVLFITNVATSVIALTLAVLATIHRLELPAIFVLSALRSATQSFDSPPRQSWVPLLVPRAYVGNAIGLNSVAFNAPSIVGPPLAGLLILSTGVAASFYTNAVATLAVVVSLAFMKPAPPSSTKREPMLASIAAGLRFLWQQPVLRSVVLMLVVTSLCVRPYTQLLPAYAAHVVHVDARGFGLLLAAAGSGGILGSVVTALVGSRRRGAVWFASAAVMSLGTFALGFVHVFAVAFAVLMMIGLAVLSFVGSSNVLLQTLSPDDMRGRSISVFSMIILGLVPLGSLLLGSIATVTGLSAALCIGGAVAFVAAIVAFMRNAALRAV